MNNPQPLKLSLKLSQSFSRKFPPLSSIPLSLDCEISSDNFRKREKNSFSWSEPSTSVSSSKIFSWVFRLLTLNNLFSLLVKIELLKTSVVACVNWNGRKKSFLFGKSRGNFPDIRRADRFRVKSTKRNWSRQRKKIVVQFCFGSCH